jgi:Fic family protein
MDSLFNPDPEPAPWEPHQIHAQTSIDAGHSIRSIKGHQQRKVFNAIRSYGLTGITAQQIGIVLEMDGNSVRPRIVELMTQGLIEEAGTRPTKSNRQATVYVVKRDA